MRMNEFGMIGKFFTPLTLGHEAALGLLDDAAVVDVPDGHTLVVTKDAISEGVHFIGNESPDLIARKLLRVNLSDLAAMGAEPVGLLLAIMLPKTVEDTWVELFARGISEDQEEFPVPLVGGDTIATIEKGFSASLTALGIVPKDKYLRRKGACIGDDLYFSGTLGDGTLGLHHLEDRLGYTLPRNHATFLSSRYQLPIPRLGLGKALRGVATAAIDVSDGLVQDAGHLCREKNIGAVISLESIPLSEAATYIINQDMNYINTLISGGDDYELLFTAPPGKNDAVERAAREAGVRVTRIGQIVEKPGVNVIGLNGEELFLNQAGFRHF
jgi:thiamine-monophosphate kinase